MQRVSDAVIESYGAAAASDQQGAAQRRGRWNRLQRGAQRSREKLRGAEGSTAGATDKPRCVKLPVNAQIPNTPPFSSPCHLKAPHRAIIPPHLCLLRMVSSLSASTNLPAVHQRSPFVLFRQSTTCDVTKGAVLTLSQPCLTLPRKKASRRFDDSVSLLTGSSISSIRPCDVPPLPPGWLRTTTSTSHPPCCHVAKRKCESSSSWFIFKRREKRWRWRRRMKRQRMRRSRGRRMRR